MALVFSIYPKDRYYNSPHAIVHLEGNFRAYPFLFNPMDDCDVKTDEDLARLLFEQWPDCRVILDTSLQSVLHPLNKEEFEEHVKKESK